LVAWPGDQPSTDRGEEPSGAATEDPAVDETSLLTWLELIGAHGQTWAEAAHDLILCFYVFMFYVFMFSFMFLM